MASSVRNDLPGGAPHRLNDEARDVMRNRVFERYENFMLAHVEFDDQGRFWATGTTNGMNQFEALEAMMERMMGHEGDEKRPFEDGVLIFCFVHGWNNNAAEGNANLDNLRDLLHRFSKEEKEFAAASGRPARSVLGIYMSWRGKQIADGTEWPVVRDLNRIPGVRIPLQLLNVPRFLTYWNRKGTAEQVGRRSMAAALTHLYHLRGEVDKAFNVAPSESHSRVIVIGHSFGGAAVFSAVNRFFEDSLIHVVDEDNEDITIGRRWDLVLLANPAFEALQYDMIHTLNQQLPDLENPNPTIFLPRMSIIRARNDVATGPVFK
ncbi:MAG: hypothetical protein AAF492_32580, partial [Verrucomicrobiota bacterium]